MYRADTIVARATAAGRSAVAIVRLSGPDACRIASRILRGKHRDFGAVPGWKLGRFSAIDPTDSRVIDDVLAVRMPAPTTYTGEDVVEIHCHGSPIITDALLRITTTAGARLADPGEFTRRAVLNGRMDLVQAEAISELIDASVLSGVKAAWGRLAGSLSETLRGHRSAMVAALAQLEAHIDFSDDDLPEENPTDLRMKLIAIRSELVALACGFAVSRREREGYRVVLIGKPNVGKSSILNALVGFDRAVVSDEPGTTRDAVTEIFDLDGFAMTVADTAGVRDAESTAERISVERSRRAAEEADVLICVFDSSRPLDDEDREILLLAEGANDVVKVLNKSDLRCGLSPGDQAVLGAGPKRVVQTTAVHPGGCDALRMTLVSALRAMTPDTSAGVGLGRERHRIALERAAKSVGGAAAHLIDVAQTELAALELRQALHDLASITELLDDDQVLDVIFSSFCVGK